MPIRRYIQKIINGIKDGTITEVNFDFLDGLQTDEVIAIAEALKDPRCKVTLLNLESQNSGGDEGVKAITEALKHPNSQLLSVYLGGNNIGDKGAKLIADVLKNPSCKLLSLGLEDNNIGDKGAKLIAEALKRKNCKLTFLRIDSNYITEEGYMALREVMWNRYTGRIIRCSKFIRKVIKFASKASLWNFRNPLPK